MDKCGRERECEEETHADRMRQKKQTTERHSDRELRGPVQQPTLFLPLFPLRDSHEATPPGHQLAPPPPTAALRFHGDREIMPADDCLPC